MPRKISLRPMATFDQLGAEQRAIIELVLKQGKTYDELSDLLGMPETRVQELARDALVKLSPVTAERVDDDWRGQLADYVLGQQSGPESTATKGHLRRSEAARSWTRSLLDSLDDFYAGDGMPSVPEGDRDRRPAARPRRRAAAEEEEDEERPRRRELSAAAQAAVRRRRILAAVAGLAVLVALAVLVWPIGLLTKDDEPRRRARAQVEQAVLRPVEGARGAGLALVAVRGNQRQLVVQARLQPVRPRQAYEVWLYNSDTDARSMGAQVTDQQGNYQGAGPLPRDFRKYRYIDISLESVDRNPRHSGRSVLRGRLDQLRPVPTGQGQGGVGAPPGGAGGAVPPGGGAGGGALPPDAGGGAGGGGQQPQQPQQP